MLRTRAAAIDPKRDIKRAELRWLMQGLLWCLLLIIPTSAVSLERQRMVRSKDVPSPYPILSPCQGEELETMPFCLKSCACNVWNLTLYDYICMQNDIQIACQIAVKICPIAQKVPICQPFSVRLHIIHILVSDCT